MTRLRTHNLRRKRLEAKRVRSDVQRRRMKALEDTFFVGALKRIFGSIVGPGFAAPFVPAFGSGRPVNWPGGLLHEQSGEAVLAGDGIGVTNMVITRSVEPHTTLDLTTAEALKIAVRRAVYRAQAQIFFGAEPPGETVYPPRHLRGWINPLKDPET